MNATVIVKLHFYFTYEGKATSENNLTLLPLAMKSETKVKNVKAREEKFRSEIKEETEGNRVKAKVEVEGAKMKTRRSLALDGLKLVNIYAQF